MGKKKGKGDKKGKKTRKKTVRTKKNEYFEAGSDSIERKKMNCPKCGPGVFLGEHKDRFVCGKCSYTKWK